MDPINVEAEDLLCDETFQRYCSGEREADVATWEAWIRNHPEKQSVVAAAKRMHDMLTLGQGNRLEQLAALKDAVARRSRFKETLLNRQEDSHNIPGRVITIRRRTWLKYAASILVLVTVGILAYLIAGPRRLAQPHNYEYYTGLHDHKTILLPDSTVVMLNANSHLSISKDFDAHHRQVSITGEAYFDVKHDAEHPFLVNTSQYTIKVLGTTFNVKAYPGKDTTETTLLTGKIEIVQGAGDSTKPKVVLRPNEKFLLTAATTTDVQPGSGKKAALTKETVVKLEMDTTTTIHHFAETAWARNKMEIKDRTLEEIATQLQAWYGITIRFTDDAVKNYRYTATFDDETIINILRYLQKSYPFDYSIEDDCIVIARS
jgi:transmembrane sensor